MDTFYHFNLLLNLSLVDEAFMEYHFINDPMDSMGIETVDRRGRIYFYLCSLWLPEEHQFNKGD
ncbi:hypothetical protein [Paenibacillus sp. FSL K6-2524]|uniref:hypothetical protein n=1 Tax=Paenibacillus sp. FSL K6-2524 TaxID=2954516 RepID=UPI0030FABE11